VPVLTLLLYRIIV